jgi:hypothetical protein
MPRLTDASCRKSWLISEPVVLARHAADVGEGVEPVDAVSRLLSDMPVVALASRESGVPDPPLLSELLKTARWQSWSLCSSYNLFWCFIHGVSRWVVAKYHVHVSTGRIWWQVRYEYPFSLEAAENLFLDRTLP